MEVELSEAQRMLRDSARDFLSKECPKEKVRELEEDTETGYSPEIWSRIAELGWLGLIIPEEYGGEGMTLQELTVLVEEMGRNIFPGPFLGTTISGTVPILEAGTGEQKELMLSRIAGGEAIVSLALHEDLSDYSPEDINTQAVAEGDRYVVNGTKFFAEMGHLASEIILAARTNESAEPANGITLFMIDAATPGISIDVMPTTGMDKLCEVNFENVKISGENILGNVNEAWPIVEMIISRGALAKCAEAVGGMQASLELSVNYAKERFQYEQPIGAFQVLQHWMADMYIAQETGKYLCYQAAWTASEGFVALPMEIHLAKAYINEAYKSVTQKAVRIHGGMGTARDHDIGLYFRRAKAASVAFGDTEYHRSRVADGIGLIRSSAHPPSLSA